jgi:molecular chaperone DnaJ
VDQSYFDKNGNIIDYYTIFSIPRDAGLDQIKSAFRSLIKKYHPDTSASNFDHKTEKIDVIIRGYRVLSDEGLRLEYDRALFGSGNMHSGVRIIPKKRILYSVLLGDMLKARLAPKNMKRKDILNSFGQDIEIIVTQAEAISGACAYVELPARMLCPLCMGKDAHCFACKGIGRIHTSSQLEVRIPPHVDGSTYIDVDLLGMSPDKQTTFCNKSVRIKITIADKKTTAR